MRKLITLLVALVALAASAPVASATCLPGPCADPVFPMTKTNAAIKTWTQWVGDTYPINSYWSPLLSGSDPDAFYELSSTDSGGSEVIGSASYQAGSGYHTINFLVIFDMHSSFSGQDVLNIWQDNTDYCSGGVCWPKMRCFTDYQVTYNRYWPATNADGTHDLWILVQARDGSHNPDMGNSGGWKCKLGVARGDGSGPGQILQN